MSMSRFNSPLAIAFSFLILHSAACATDSATDEPTSSDADDSGKADTADSDGSGLSSQPAVLTCEDPQSAQDPRTAWQVWLDPIGDEFVLRLATNVYNPFEDFITLEVQELGRYDSCAAAAADNRFINCTRLPSFFRTALIDTTVLPFGGSSLSSSDKFDLTFQQVRPQDRQSFEFFSIDDCWPTADDRLSQ